MTNETVMQINQELLEALKWVRTLYRPDDDSDMVKAMDAAIVKAESARNE